MKQSNTKILQINSVSALHRFVGLPEPVHPLIAVSKCADMNTSAVNKNTPFVLNLYTIAVLSDFGGKQFKYGPDYYYFNTGTLCFVGPGHLIKEMEYNADSGGTSVYFHLDLFRNSDLAKTINAYNFFTYTVNQALKLSPEEEKDILSIMENIKKEYSGQADCFTESVMIAQMGLLLNYCARFFRRQFEVGTNYKNDLIVRLEIHLEEFFNNGNLAGTGIPTVHTVSEQLYVSPSYLSNVVRSMTGQNAQQYIHSKLIEKAKLLLGNSAMNISEVAYQLGFDYPQSFNRLFKKKMNISPMAYRKSFA